MKQRKQQIEAQLASIDAREKEIQRKRETRANIIIGAVVRRHAALHPAFAHALGGILDIGVRRRADRELLASVLGLSQLAGEADGTHFGQRRCALSVYGTPVAGKLAAFARNAGAITGRR